MESTNKDFATPVTGTLKGEIKKRKEIIPIHFPIYLTILIIVFVLGCAAGFKGATKIYSNKMEECKKLGGIIIDGIVYDIKVRPTN